MERGAEVYFYHNGMKWNYTFVREVPEAGAVIIQNGSGDYRCRPSEIRLKSEVDAEEATAKQVRDNGECAAVIKMWEAGIKTGKAMAPNIGTTKEEATRLIRLAKRQGFIKDSMLDSTPSIGKVSPDEDGKRASAQGVPTENVPDQA